MSTANIWLKKLGRFRPCDGKHINDNYIFQTDGHRLHALRLNTRFRKQGQPFLSVLMQRYVEAQNHGTVIKISVSKSDLVNIIKQIRGQRKKFIFDPATLQITDSQLKLSLNGQSAFCSVTTHHQSPFVFVKQINICYLDDAVFGLNDLIAIELTDDLPFIRLSSNNDQKIAFIAYMDK